MCIRDSDNSISLRLRRTWRSLWRRALDTDHGEGEPNPSYIPLANQLARVFAGKVSGVPQSSIMEALFDTPTTAHILGGAAIGASADAGVIDERNEVFGHPGLYVCDGSMIPANLGVNPSLTITAVTELAMSHIPVKEGATLRRAVDEELQARRVAEIEALAQETGSASLQRHLPVHS